jgi:hypothetical protein
MQDGKHDNLMVSREETVFEMIMKELNMDSFANLDDIVPLTNTTYQKQTGDRLAICRSERDKFHVYQCVEHINCCFKIQVG